jgi:hypothetical protein
VKEDVNKDELLKWPDERLKLVGASRVVSDDFWLECIEEVVLEPSPIGYQSVMKAAAGAKS